MPTLHEVIPREYRDSVALMQLSAALAKRPGIAQAAAVMGTENNLGLLRQAGIALPELQVGPNDLLIVVQGDADALQGAIEEARARLSESAPQRVSDAARETAAHSIMMTLGARPDAHLAIVSTPGEYATAEALKALNLGLDVMLFSNNVSVGDEVMLKRTAREKGLIVMGPDCGTAIINGIPLAFANVVRRGSIGLVSASGTGLQEVTVLIDRLGAGISQAIGTGGNDLSAEVGGISMLAGLDCLIDDHSTDVIVLISKPPAKAIAETILAKARSTGKPVVIAFMGADPRGLSGRNLHGVRTLEDAARLAVALSRGCTSEAGDETVTLPAALPRFATGQKCLRALFSGGTFALQATILLQETLDVHSNTTVGRSLPLHDPFRSAGHTVVDLGADALTRGRPHPMIDYRLRAERIVQEARDPETAVLLLDVVLGFGSHADPAAELVPALATARTIAEQNGRALICIGHICGTDGDPQGRASQARALADAGMILAESSAQAVRIAGKIIEALDARGGRA
ncbi:MAG: acyl-CoA synthetase FdrA [Hyphomicrobiales bacterium]|nr:acyl-CoA synthetase FdrA [Hyphomicrobiales bacterium]